MGKNKSEKNREKESLINNLISLLLREENNKKIA